jgi:hypothetical protein
MKLKLFFAHCHSMAVNCLIAETAQNLSKKIQVSPLSKIMPFRSSFFAENMHWLLKRIIQIIPLLLSPNMQGLHASDIITFLTAVPFSSARGIVTTRAAAGG